MTTTTCAFVNETLPAWWLHLHILDLLVGAHTQSERSTQSNTFRCFCTCNWSGIDVHQNTNTLSIPLKPNNTAFGSKVSFWTPWFDFFPISSAPFLHPSAVLYEVRPPNTGTPTSSLRVLKHHPTSVTRWIHHSSSLAPSSDARSP